MGGSPPHQGLAMSPWTTTGEMLELMNGGEAGRDLSIHINYKVFLPKPHLHLSSEKWCLKILICISNCECAFPSWKCPLTITTHWLQAGALESDCLGSNPGSITYGLVASGKIISFHAPQPQTQKRDHNNNDLIRELYELTNTTLRTRGTGSGVLSRHYLLLLAHISDRSCTSFLLICKSS